MNKLLRAYGKRLWGYQLFWMFAAFMAAFAGLVCLWTNKGGSMVQETIAFDGLFFKGYGIGGIIAVPGLVMAVLVSLFIGTEYSDGTLRNKVIVGRSRVEIYLSGFFTCAAAGVLLNCIYMAAVCAIGIPLFGGFQMEWHTVLLLAADGTLAVIAYAAIFHLLAVLISSKAAAAVISLLGTVIVMFALGYLTALLSSAEFIDTMRMIDGEMILERIPNPNYVSGNLREILQFFVDLLPSGQCLQISSGTAPHLERMPFYSLGIIVLVNAVGILLFRKKDLK